MTRYYQARTGPRPLEEDQLTGEAPVAGSAVGVEAAAADEEGAGLVASGAAGPVAAAPEEDSEKQMGAVCSGPLWFAVG